MPKGKNHDVICPGCRESFHETTKKFRPNRDANAGMLQLKRQYTAAEGNQWDEVPPDPSAGYGILVCPGCDAPLAPSGRLLVREKELPPRQSPIEELDKSYSDTQADNHIVIESDDKLPPLIVNGKGEIKEWVCDEPRCDKGPFKSRQGLSAHSRVHKKK